MICHILAKTAWTNILSIHMLSMLPTHCCWGFWQKKCLGHTDWKYGWKHSPPFLCVCIPQAQCLARMYAAYRVHVMAQLWYQKQKAYRWRVWDRFERVLQLFLYLWLSLKRDLSKLSWSKTSSSSLQFACLHWHIHTCMCYRLRSILIFLQNGSYHKHIICIPDFHIRRLMGMVV